MTHISKSLDWALGILHLKVNLIIINVNYPSVQEAVQYICKFNASLIRLCFSWLLVSLQTCLLVKFSNCNKFQNLQSESQQV